MSTSYQRTIRDNATQGHDNSIQRNSAEWIAFETTACIFTVLSLYFTFALLYYQYRRWKLNHIPFQNYRTHRSLTVTSSIASERVGRRRKKILHELCVVVAAIAIVLRMLSEQSMLNFFNISDKVCRIISSVHVIMYALPISAIYLFLWARQRIFYSSSGVLREFNSMKVRFVSAAILVGMIVGEAATILVFTLMLTYKPVRLGCDLHDSLLPKWIPWAMVIAFSSVFQTLLLSLYIMPIIKLRMRQNNDSSKHDGDKIRRHGVSAINATLRRVCAAAFTCVISDLLAGLITYSILIPSVSNLIYNLNLLVNLICVICSFGDWRQRLCPLVAWKRNNLIIDHQISPLVSRNQRLPQKSEP